MADPSAVSCATRRPGVRNGWGPRQEHDNPLPLPRRRVGRSRGAEFRGFAQVDRNRHRRRVRSRALGSGADPHVVPRRRGRAGRRFGRARSARQLDRRPATDRPLSGERVADRPDRPETPPGAASTGRQAPPQRAIQGGHRNGLATRRLPTAVHNHPGSAAQPPPRRRRPRRHADRRRSAPRGTDHAMGARSRAHDPGSL